MLFSNPPWDIILQIYRAALDERPISVADLTRHLPIPAPTTLRSIDALVQLGLIRCSSSLFSCGAAHVELTQTGLRQMDAYFLRLPPVVGPS